MSLCGMPRLAVGPQAQLSKYRGGEWYLGDQHVPTSSCLLQVKMRHIGDEIRESNIAGCVVFIFSDASSAVKVRNGGRTQRTLVGLPLWAIQKVSHATRNGKLLYDIETASFASSLSGLSLIPTSRLVIGPISSRPLRSPRSHRAQPSSKKAPLITLKALINDDLQSSNSRIDTSAYFQNGFQCLSCASSSCSTLNAHR